MLARTAAKWTCTWAEINCPHIDAGRSGVMQLHIKYRGHVGKFFSTSERIIY